ncbi:MAG: DUF1572 family protein, partial [Candidatus Latescibacterota bacterium]
YTRDEVNEIWISGWSILSQALDELTDDDLLRIVRIRGTEWTVDAALARSLAHLAYHVGQIVLLARMARGDSWGWISIPKGASRAYNQDPDKERDFGLR